MKFLLGYIIALFAVSFVGAMWNMISDFGSWDGGCTVCSDTYTSTLCPIHNESEDGIV